MRYPKVTRMVIISVASVGCAAAGAEEPGPVTLQSLTLTPATVAVQAGASAQFAVAGSWSDGSATAPEVTYAATGGTVSAGGLYTAGASAGDYRVIATHLASGRADTAAVTVTVTPPPPPPPPPPGATVLFSEGFEDNNASSRGWYDNVAAWTTTTDQAHSGSRSLAWAWAQGSVLSGFGGAARREFAASEQVYLRYWVKYSANFIGSGVPYHPHEFHFLTNANGRFTGPSFTRLTMYVEHIWGPNGGFPRIGSTDGQNIDVSRVRQDLTGVTEQRSTSGCNGSSDGLTTDCYSIGGGNYNNGKWIGTPNDAPVLLNAAGASYKGDWHKVEVLFRLNTVVNGIGQTDGVAQYWFDGQLKIDRQNVLWRTGAQPTLAWTQFLMAPYIQVGSPVAQTMWIDDLVVATGRIP